MLVECQGLTKMFHVRVEGCKRKALRDHANRAHGVPIKSSRTPLNFIPISTRSEPANQTASSWMSTSIENAFLKAALCFHPVSSSREYILYANGTCWWFDFGNKPTYRMSMGLAHSGPGRDEPYEPWSRWKSPVAIRESLFRSDQNSHPSQCTSRVWDQTQLTIL